MEKKPKITQAKAPTKWEILKAKAKFTKEYLKGQFVEGTQVTARNKVVYHTEKIFTDEYRKRRKKRNKAAYISRRKNRSGL